MVGGEVALGYGVGTYQRSVTVPGEGSSPISFVSGSFGFISAPAFHDNRCSAIGACYYSSPTLCCSVFLRAEITLLWCSRCRPYTLAPRR